MATNIVFEPGYNLSVVVTYPTSPVSGGVCLYGNLTGLAMTDENATTLETSVNFGPWVTDLSVVDSNTGGIAKGDSLFASQATPVVVSNDSTGVFLGYANETVSDGETATIEVIHPPMIGGILGLGAIGATQLASDSVTGAKIVIPIDLSSKTPGSTTTGTILKVGTSATPFALNTAGQSGEKSYYSTTATSDTTYGQYTMLEANGAGVEAIGGRSRVLLKLNTVGNAHGRHDSLETDTSAGAITGLGTGHRANLVIADRAHAAGTYYGAMAEIFPLGNTAALPANSNACLGINAQTGTAMDLVANAISFSGADGTGKMIYTATDSAPPMVGSIRILVNGVQRYLHFSNAEAAGS
jgi:hypothetical protein